MVRTDVEKRSGPPQGDSVFIIFLRRVFAGICLFFFSLAVLQVNAQGSSAANNRSSNAEPIVIGQSVALSGPEEAQGREFKVGADAFFDALNQAGGVNGRKIKLVSLDDGGDAKRAQANTQQLVETENALALFGYAGVAAVNAVVPLTEKYKVPLVGAASGDAALRDPANRYVFNVRASYEDEAARLIMQLVNSGVNKIALFYQNDAYGRAGLAAVDRAMRERKLNIVIFGSVDRDSLKVVSAAQTIGKSGAQAVIISAGANSSAAFIKEMKKLGAPIRFCTLSSVGSRSLAGLLGDSGRGMEITQVVPFPFAGNDPLVREYLARIGGAGKAGFGSFEGYIAAKVLAEGLKKAGKNISREGLFEALEKLGSIDIGGYRVAYSPGSHIGSSFVDTTVIGGGGSFKQ